MEGSVEGAHRDENMTNWACNAVQCPINEKNAGRAYRPNLHGQDIREGGSLPPSLMSVQFQVGRFENIPGKIDADFAERFLLAPTL